MSWDTDIRVAADLPSNPKLLDLEDRLEEDFGPHYRNQALTCLIRLWAYVANQKDMRATGCLGTIKPRLIERVAGWTGEPGGLYRALRESNWIEVAEDGNHRIHDWAEHQPYLAAEPMRRAHAKAGADARWAKKREKEAREVAKAAKAAVSQDFYDWIKTTWNGLAGAKGFAKLRGVTDARKRAINATCSEFGSGEDTWRAAIEAYVADVDRWPERVKFGFDTFVRPSTRAKWFEGIPGVPDDDPTGRWDLGDD